MKKYYCPYCGKRSLRVGQKLNAGLTWNFYHNRCNHCTQSPALKSHWLVHASFIVAALFLFASLILESIPLLIAFAVIDIVIYNILSILLKKFIRRSKDEPIGKSYYCQFDFSGIKHPWLFMQGHSILMLTYLNKSLPVFIESEKSMLSENKIKITFLNADVDINLLHQTIHLYDDDRCIGKGTIIKE